MQIQRKALYNSLRQNWLIDSSIEVFEWQVEDYRILPIEEIFKRLSDLGLPLDRSTFTAFAEQNESPEDLSDHLLADQDELTTQEQDQIFLLIFELWRRLLPERLCLSVFCDELDYQINLYDDGKIGRPDSIQDILANLQELLDENTDLGVSPVDVMTAISDNCANDVEGFLYDFITDQIDESHISYASDLVDGFAQYVSDPKWFDFLRARVLVDSDPAAANALFAKLIANASDYPNLEFHLELLAYMVLGGERSLFVALVKAVLPSIEWEEDFSELLGICVDFYQRLDYEWEDQALQDILDERQAKPSEASVLTDDPHRTELIRILEKRAT